MSETYLPLRVRFLFLTRILSVFSMIISFLDEPCRIASDNRHGRDIVHHDAVGPDNCPVAYPYPGQDGGADAYPDLVLDDYRTGQSPAR